MRSNIEWTRDSQHWNCQMVFLPDDERSDLGTFDDEMACERLRWSANPFPLSRRFGGKGNAGWVCRARSSQVADIFRGIIHRHLPEVFGAWPHPWWSFTFYHLKIDAVGPRAQLKLTKMGCSWASVSKNQTMDVMNLERPTHNELLSERMATAKPDLEHLSINWKAGYDFNRIIAKK